MKKLSRFVFVLLAVVLAVFGYKKVKVGKES